MPHEYEYDHLLHPATLDGVFQTFFTAINSNQGLVPNAIESMYVSNHLPQGAGGKLSGFIKAARKGFRHFVGDLVMSDEDWTQPKVVVKGFLGTELGATSSDADSSQDSSALIRKLCSSVTWKEDIDHLAQKDAEIVLHPSPQDGITTPSALTEFEQAARMYMLQALSTLDPGVEASAAPHLVHFIQWMRRRIELTNGGPEELGAAEAASVLERIMNKGIDGQVLSAIGQSLPEILNGSASPESILSRDGMFARYRTESVGLKRATNAMMKWLDFQAHKKPGLDYLEVGSGAGSISSAALQILTGEQTPRLKQYTFTDSDPSCFENAQKTLKKWQDRVQYKKLDLDKNPADQGFEKESVDVIIAGNVSTFVTHQESHHLIFDKGTP